MFGISDFSAFVVAILLFLLIPGPGNLALITSTGKGGIRAGMAACAGVLAADQVLIWMAVAGVAALLASYPTAFHAMQWLGAAYLGWLGFRMLTAKPGDKPVLHIEPRHYFRQAPGSQWPTRGVQGLGVGGLAHIGKALHEGQRRHARQHMDAAQQQGRPLHADVDQQRDQG